MIKAKLTAARTCLRIRGCLITYVNPQVGVFLLKLHIVKREHSGCYVTDEQWQVNKKTPRLY